MFVSIHKGVKIHKGETPPTKRTYYFSLARGYGILENVHKRFS